MNEAKDAEAAATFKRIQTSRAFVHASVTNPTNSTVGSRRRNLSVTFSDASLATAMKSRHPAERLSAPAVKIHPHAWLWEPLADEPSFVLRSMFGAKAAYLEGKLVLAFCAGEEPWRGVLVCTSHEHHASLVQEFPELSPHPILPKWLYLPEDSARFEAHAVSLVRCVRARDPRIGVLPKPRARKASRVAGKRARRERPR